MERLGIFKDFNDETLKYVFQSPDKKIIEMSLLFNKEEIDVVCAPTHHFCNLGCKICHLTNKGLNKKMIPITQEDFIGCLINTLMTNKGIRRTNKKKLLISFMGVGEPLLNLSLIKGIFQDEDKIKKTLNYEEISYAISTMMPNRNVEKLIEMVLEYHIPLKLHFSLHTPINEDRKDLIPSTTVSVKEAMELMVSYRNSITKDKIIMENYQHFHRTKDPIEIHYTLIRNINDEEKELDTLCELLNEYRIPIKFIRFNPINELEISANELHWIETINDRVSGLRIKAYSPPGREIGSSCGEFTKHYYHEEIETESQRNEFEKWKELHEIFE